MFLFSKETQRVMTESDSAELIAKLNRYPLTQVKALLGLFNELQGVIKSQDKGYEVTLDIEHVVTLKDDCIKIENLLD
jgi:hypothetical protein